MTPRQKLALQHTCRLAEETAHPRFRRVHVDGGLTFTTVLSLNSGYE